MNSGLEAKMIPTKVDGKAYGSKVMQDRWYVVHSASGRSLSTITCDCKEQADAYIARIYSAIPEADWTKPVSELVGITNLQVRIIQA